MTVVSVKASNDSQKVGGYCDIIVPLNSYIQYKNPNNNQVYLTSIRSDKFPQGSPVTVVASYAGYPPVQVFSGYVYDFVLGTPLTIKCMDYIYFYNLGIFGEQRVTVKNKKGDKIKAQGQGVHYKSIQFKTLLQDLIDFVNDTIDTEAPGSPHTELILPVFDMELQNLTFINMSPAAILDWFKKELGLNITLYGSKLYVNLASNTTGSVTLNTGRNVLKSNLQTKLATFQRIRMKCWFIREDGTRDSIEVGDSSGQQMEHFFYKVKRSGNNYETLANAALLKAQQHRYSGELEILLYPNCDLFWKVPYTDVRYPEKNGTYVIIGMYFELGPEGFHRKLKLAYLDDLI